MSISSISNSGNNSTPGSQNSFEMFSDEQLKEIDSRIQYKLNEFKRNNLDNQNIKIEARLDAIEINLSTLTRQLLQKTKAAAASVVVEVVEPNKVVPKEEIVWFSSSEFENFMTESFDLLLTKASKNFSWVWQLR
jgi:hypothetical protein